MPGHRNSRILFDANVFLEIAKAELTNESSEELKKVIRETQYVIKSTKLIRHYAGAIHHVLKTNAEPFLRTVLDRLQTQRPKLTKDINDRLAQRHNVGFQVHSDDHFLYQLAIEAKRGCEVLFVSNDPGQTKNDALMQATHHIPIIDSDDFVQNYC